MGCQKSANSPRFKAIFVIDTVSKIPLTFSGVSTDRSGNKNGVLLPYFVASNSTCNGNRIAGVVNSQELTSYSPIVFVGSSGSGKTVLAEQVAFNFRSMQNCSVCRTNGADFARSFATAVDANSVDSWRQKFSKKHCILFEQVHLLSKKSGALLELEKLIDHFSVRQKLLVFTSIIPLNEIEGFSRRLLSRFSGGLSLSLELPDLVSRKNLVRDFLDLADCSASDEAIELLAEKSPYTAMELSSLIQRITSDTLFLDVEKVSSFLAVKTVNKQLTVKKIFTAVSKRFGVSVADIKGPSRKQNIVRARSVCVYLCRKLCDLSLDRIGSLFGNRDHSTILYAFRKIEKQIEDGDEISVDVRELSVLLRGVYCG